MNKLGYVSAGKVPDLQRFLCLLLLLFFFAQLFRLFILLLLLFTLLQFGL